jgi:DNA (cytosine-5)-methyltransferase 1
MYKGINTTCDEGQTPVLAPQAFYSTESRCDGIPVPDLSPPLKVGSNGGGQPPAVAFTKSKRAQSTTDDESRVPGEVSPTMSCFDQGDTRATTVVAVRTAQTSANGHGVAHDVTHTLDRVQGQAVAFSHSAAANSHGIAYVEEGTPPLRGGGAGNSMPAVAQAMSVRRLTPRECERLQGFPDDYTLVEYRKKPAADGPRYRALGNSMAVPVMRWIGERIKMVDELRSSP